MQILLLTQFYPPIIGGEERHVRNLAIALSQRGHKVTVATQWVPGTLANEIDGNVQIYRVRGTMQRLSGLFAESERRHAPPFPDPELTAGLSRVVRLEKPDVVHAHNWLLASYLPIKLWTRTSLVVSLHDYSLVCAKKNFMHEGEICTGPSLSKCLSCAQTHYGAAKATVTTLGNYITSKFTRRVVDKFIAVSHAVARYNRLDGLPFDVIPNFVPDDVGEVSTEIDSRVQQLPERFVLFVGDIMHLKGADVLVNAYAQLNQAPPLVMIGRRHPDGPKEFPMNVIRFDPWPHAAIMQAWHKCLFGVLPSVGPEACATVIMEAMACGKPMIASNIGGMPDLVDHNETGLLVLPNDVASLRDALQSMLANPASIARMGETSLARVGRLKASAVVARIEQVYESVIRSNSAQQRAGAHSRA